MTLPIIKPAFRLAAKIISFAIFLLTIAAGYGGYVNPDYFAFPSAMVLAFPYLAILTFIIAAVWLLSGRIITGAAGIGALLITGGPLLQAVPLSFPKSASEGADTFTLLTYNILHGNDYRNPGLPGSRSLEYVIKSDADIVCLQELILFNKSEIKNYSQQLDDSLRKAYPYIAGKDWSDLKVLSKYPVRRLDVEIPGEEPEGNPRYRFEFFKVNIKGRELNIVNMHMNSYNLTEEEREVVTDIRGVNSAKASFKEMKGTIWEKMKYSFRTRKANVALLLATAATRSTPIIVCGDFNDVAASYAYRMMIKDGFKDAFAETHFLPVYTYNAHLFLLHLDQIFYKGDIKALSVKRGSVNSSDHYPLLATFEFL